MGVPKKIRSIVLGGKLGGTPYFGNWLYSNFRPRKSLRPIAVSGLGLGFGARLLKECIAIQPLPRGALGLIDPKPHVLVRNSARLVFALRTKKL